MRHREAGRITDELWYLGNEDVCVYLLEGDNGSMLINGGVACVVPQLLDQFRCFGIDEGRINKLLILHSHSDHVGIIPYFQRRYPDLVVYGSARSLQVLNDPKVQSAINSSEAYTTQHRGMTVLCQGYDLQWREGVDGIAVAEGDRIDLGDKLVEIIELPGHSPCSIAAYAPRLGALFPSDGGGIPFADVFLTPGASDFSTFVASLHKLQGLHVNYLCADHCGYVSGEEAASHISNTIRAAEANRVLMMETLLRVGSVDAAANELATRFVHEEFGNLVPHETFVQLYRAMLKSIAGIPRSA